MTANSSSTAQNAQKPPHILLVEDNEADIELTKMAFEEEHFDCSIDVARNGTEGMDYLRKREPYQNSPLPDLILLDLNMPRMDGRQFLEAIKYDRWLKNIPVMLLTNSRAPQDVNTCYHLQANCYIVKPGSMSERATMVKRVADFLHKTGITVFLTQGIAKET